MQCARFVGHQGERPGRVQLDRRDPRAKAGQHDRDRGVLLHDEGGGLVPAAEGPQHAAHPWATQPFGDPVRLALPPTLQLLEVRPRTGRIVRLGLDRLQCDVLIAKIGQLVAGATEVAVGQASRNHQHRAEQGEDGPESPEGHPQVVERLGVLPVDEAPPVSAELASGIGDGRRGRRCPRPGLGGGRGWDGLGGGGHGQILPRNRRGARGQVRGCVTGDPERLFCPLQHPGSVAQLDRALASGARGRAFESRRAHRAYLLPRHHLLMCEAILLLPVCHACVPCGIPSGPAY